MSTAAIGLSNKLIACPVGPYLSNYNLILSEIPMDIRRTRIDCSVIVIVATDASLLSSRLD